MQVPKNLTADEAQQLLVQREQLEEIAAYRSDLKKEAQFSQKVELNMRIKKLEERSYGG